MDKPIPEAVAWPFSILEAGNWREVYMGTKHMRLEVSYPYEAWERLMAAITAAQQQGQAVAADRSDAAPEVFNAKLVPNLRMPITLAYRLAMNEAIPAAAPQPTQQDDGECECSHEAWEENGGWCKCVDCGHGWSARTAPPSAPVGVDAAKHWHDLYRKECQLRQDDAARYGQQIVDLEALAQQPAAVDGAMVMVQKHDALILADFAKAHGGAMEQLAARRIASLATQHQEPTT